jgi:HPt (histidine-containing phosphotransfer) domain-containing protein
MAKPFAMTDLARSLEQFLPKTDRQPALETAVTLPAELATPGSDFDISCLLELEDPEYIRHIFNLFTEKMPPYLQELKSFLATGHWEEFLEKTHKVKGSLSSVQIREVYELILDMEEKVQARQSLAGLEPVLDQCLSVYNHVIPAINLEVEKQLARLEAN